MFSIISETFGSIWLFNRLFEDHNMSQYQSQRRYPGRLQCGQPNVPDDCEYFRNAFNRIRKENQDLLNMIKHLQEEKSQLEDRNRELEAQHQTNLQIIEEGWEMQLKKMQQEVIKLLVERKESKAKFIEMNNRVQEMEQLQNKQQVLEEKYQEKKDTFQQLEAKHEETQCKLQELEETHKKTQYTLEQTETEANQTLNMLHQSEENNKSLQKKLEQALQRNGEMDEAKKAQEENYNKLKEELAEKERKVEEAEERYRKLEAESEEIFSEVKNLTLKNKDLKEECLKKKQKRKLSRFLRRFRCSCSST